MINRTKFYEGYRKLTQEENTGFNPLNQAQVDGLNFLLDKLDGSEIELFNQYAYILATIKHETAETYRPITERGSRNYLRSKSYYPYIGRGFVQITWSINYAKFSNLLHIDLVTNPELALDPETAWRIAEYGMVHGTFTGRKLRDYLTEDKTDYLHARKIINGMDMAGLIKDYAVKFYNILENDN